MYLYNTAQSIQKIDQEVYSQKLKSQNMDKVM